jgi:hypothetical protein
MGRKMSEEKKAGSNKENGTSEKSEAMVDVAAIPKVSKVIFDEEKGTVTLVIASEK